MRLSFCSSGEAFLVVDFTERRGKQQRVAGEGALQR
jgi:hypothetical protein